MEFSQPAREQHLCSKLNLMATREKSVWISGRTYRSSFNCEQTREVGCYGTRRITGNQESTELLLDCRPTRSPERVVHPGCFSIISPRIFEIRQRLTQSSRKLKT